MVRNVAANYLGRLYSAASIYIFVPFYIRYLGIESFGIIAFYAVLLTFAGLAEVGLSTVLAREAARQPKGQTLFALLSSIERIVFVTAGIFAAGVFVAAPLIASRWLNLKDLDPAAVANAIRLMALMIVPQLAISIYIGGLMGLQQQVRANILQIIFVTVKAGLVIPLIVWKPSLELFFVWQAAVTIAFAVIVRTYVASAIGGDRYRIAPFDYAVIKPHLRFGGGLFALSIISILSTQLDKLITSKLFSVEQFAHYVLAGTLAQLPLVAVGPMVAAFLPKLTGLSQSDDRSAASRLYENCAYFVAILSSVGSIGVVLFAEEVLSLWVGRQNLSSEVILVAKILATGSLFLCIGTVPHSLGLANGNSKLAATIGCFTVGSSLILLLILAPRFGLVGAALPWVTLNSAHALVLSVFIHRRYYTGSAVKWWLNCILLPAGLAAVPLVAARQLADALALGPFWTCCLAGVFGLFGVAGLVWWRARDNKLGIGMIEDINVAKLSSGSARGGRVKLR